MATCFWVIQVVSSNYPTIHQAHLWTDLYGQQNEALSFDGPLLRSLSPWCLYAYPVLPGCASWDSNPSTALTSSSREQYYYISAPKLESISLLSIKFLQGKDLQLISDPSYSLHTYTYTYCLSFTLSAAFCLTYLYVQLSRARKVHVNNLLKPYHVCMPCIVCQKQSLIYYRYSNTTPKWYPLQNLHTICFRAITKTKRPTFLSMRILKTRILTHSHTVLLKASRQKLYIHNQTCTQIVVV